MMIFKWQLEEAALNNGWFVGVDEKRIERIFQINDMLDEDSSTDTLTSAIWPVCNEDDIFKISKILEAYRDEYNTFWELHFQHEAEANS